MASAGTPPLLFFTNFSCLAYSAIPNLTGASGTGIFMPQTLGALVAAAADIVSAKRNGIATAFALCQLGVAILHWGYFFLKEYKIKFQITAIG